MTKDRLCNFVGSVSSFSQQLYGLKSPQKKKGKEQKRCGKKRGPNRRISINNGEITNRDKFGVLDKLIPQQVSLQMRKAALSEIEFILDFFM